jgi:hypothetical protein
MLVMEEDTREIYEVVEAVRGMLKGRGRGYRGRCWRSY